LALKKGLSNIIEEADGDEFSPSVIKKENHDFGVSIESPQIVGNQADEDMEDDCFLSALDEQL
jgi:hypothetical protein